MKVPKTLAPFAGPQRETVVRVEPGPQPKVLLIGRRAFWGPFLIAALQELGCAVHFQATPQETAHSSLREFDLILGGQGCLREIHRLPGLAGSCTTVFYVFPVEDSCWWLPALQYGVDCFGSPALRPKEFSAQLKQILGQHRREAASIAS